MSPVLNSNPSQSSAAEILAELIRHQSVTPDSSLIYETIANHLRPAGFDSDIVRFEQADTPPVDNMFARKGREGPHFAFAGHVDVVPPGDRNSWSFDPFGGFVSDGLIYGRGAVDMKGAIAAFIAATRQYLDDCGDRFNGQISFILTGDEEGPAINGTAKLMPYLEKKRLLPDICLLGEPTNPQQIGDAIKIGRRGSLSGRILLTGKQGHVAYPHLAQNPIEGLPGLITLLRSLKLGEGDDEFDPAHLEITIIETLNPAINVIPEQIAVHFNIRFGMAWTSDALKAHIAEMLEWGGYSESHCALQFINPASESFITRDDKLIAMVSQAVEENTGRKPVLSTAGGTSDARFIRHYCPVVEFGLVGRSMHQIDEATPLADLECLSAIYRRCLELYFGD